MAMIEILGGDGLEYTLKELGIKATKTYSTPKDLYDHGPYYEVFEIEKKDLQKLEATLWEDDWGWWRYCKGSNMGTPYSFFQVNGKELIAWDGDYREDIIDNWADESDARKSVYHYSFKEYEEDNYPREYDNLTTYMCEELGASTEKNVCALAVDLARANGMSMAELFKTYEG